MATPPPPADAELPLIVLLMTVTVPGALNVPLLIAPPPNSWLVELPLNVPIQDGQKTVIQDAGSRVVTDTAVRDCHGTAAAMELFGPKWMLLKTPPSAFPLITQLLIVVTPS